MMKPTAPHPLSLPHAPRAVKGEFTGRHMLAIMLAFFGVVIGVNVLMAVLARTSWTGTVVENTYVASQEFNAKAAAGRAQAALGWTGTLAIADGEIAYRLVDRSGRAVPLAGVTVLFRHPAYDARDFAVPLAQGGDGFTRAETVPDGVWIVEVEADTHRGQPYRDVRRILVEAGRAR